MKGCGVVVVTVDRARAVVRGGRWRPTGTKSPSSGDLFVGLPTKSRFFLTTVAVIFVPSAQVTPGTQRELEPASARRPSTTVARPEAILPGPVRVTSVS